MTTASRCLHFDHLTALLENRLPAAEEAALIEHLDECLLCQWRLERSTGATKELSTLALHSVQSTSDFGPAYFNAVESLKGEDVDFPPESEYSDDADEPLQHLGFLSESLNPELLGRFGRYEVLEPIGRGGMGIVLKARDPLLDRITAIKVLDPHLAGHVTARKRFVREARAAAAISHDHVIVIHGVAEREGLPYLVMPYIPGVSLAEKIQWNGPLDLIDILRIGMQTASGLAAAHAQGVVHRDIKPANILLEDDVERVKITDFGLAQVVDDPSLTQSGTVAGTPGFMSPEQAQDAPIDHRSDLFSLGSVLYAMCTGFAPFRGPTSMAVIRKVCDKQPQPIRQTNPQCPQWLVDIIAKLHAKHPVDRYQSATEVAEVLRQRLAQQQSPDLIALDDEFDDSVFDAALSGGNSREGSSIESTTPTLTDPTLLVWSEIASQPFGQSARQLWKWLWAQKSWKQNWRNFWRWMSERQG